MKATSVPKVPLLPVQQMSKSLVDTQKSFLLPNFNGKSSCLIRLKWCQLCPLECWNRKCQQSHSPYSPILIFHAISALESQHIWAQILQSQDFESLLDWSIIIGFGIEDDIFRVQDQDFWISTLKDMTINSWESLWLRFQFLELPWVLFEQTISKIRSFLSHRKFPRQSSVRFNLSLPLGYFWFFLTLMKIICGIPKIRRK